MRALFIALAIAGCSGGARQIEIGPPPAKATRGTLVGPLCNPSVCKCRELTAPEDGGAGVPTDGKKRFEIRMTSANELWATVGDTTVYKSPERAEECFYVDLPAGVTTPVELRASKPEGVSAAFAIRELGTTTKSWYDSFMFACGSPGVCSFQELDDAKPKYAAYKHGVEDFCGTVKVKGLTWDTGHAPDQLHPSELLVRLGLDVTKQVASQSHGDPACGHGHRPGTPGQPEQPEGNDPN